METQAKIKSILFGTVLFCALFFCAQAFCATDPGSVSEQLNKIEISLWDTSYPNDTESKRLERIEKEVLGTVNSKHTAQERINKLNSALGLESLAEANAPLSELYTEEADGVSYPAVDMLELQLLGKNYKKENIYKRLDRLEEKVFGSSQKGDLAQRTDGLKARVSMMAPSSTLPTYSQTSPAVFGKEYTEQDVISKAAREAQMRSGQGYNAYTGYDYNYGGSDVSLQIAGLENSLFGQTFSYDPMPVRLSRLERRIFQRDFASDDEYARMDRLQAAATAKKTAKYYDQNKFQKFASTGMQLGTFILMILAMIL